MPKALVIDYIIKGDSRYEGDIIEYVLKQAGYDVRLCYKPTKERFKRELYNAYDKSIIHISAHCGRGSVSKSLDGYGNIMYDDIREYFIERLDHEELYLDETELVFFSGCGSAQRVWTDLFINTLHVKNFIGARGDPTIVEGILFPVHLYCNLIDPKGWRSVREAFRRARKEMKLKAKWELVSNEE
jgi:hypothetical protein